MTRSSNKKDPLLGLSLSVIILAGDEGFDSRSASPEARQMNIVHLWRSLAKCHWHFSPRSDRVFVSTINHEKMSPNGLIFSWLGMRDISHYAPSFVHSQKKMLRAFFCFTHYAEPADVLLCKTGGSKSCSQKQEKR